MTFRNNLTAAELAELATATDSPSAMPQSATASVRDFTYELLDLKLQDGTVPEVTFNDIDRYRAAYLYSTFDGSGPPAEGNNASGLGTISFSNADGSASATTDEAFLSAKVNMKTHSGKALASRDLQFVLSPNTRLIITVTADVFNTFGKFAGQGNAQTTLWASYHLDSAATELVTVQSEMHTALGGSQRALLSVVINSANQQIEGTVTMTASVDAVATARSAR
ncbi:MAG: hypothetical protein ACJ8LG_03150 [Massilia sp.]